MSRHDIITIGASAGGLEALIRLFSGLPADLPASVFVVLHIPPSGPSLLAEILDRHSKLPVEAAETGTLFVPGRAYVARPDRHLMIDRHRVYVTSGPRENRVRPAIDRLFRSAAVVLDGRVVGVVLTGMLDDGTSGLMAVKRCGGTAVVQEPEDAAYPGMPQSALRYVAADHVVPLDEMAGLLTCLASEPALAHPAPPPDLVAEIEMAFKGAHMSETERIGELVPITCPDCGGSLWQVAEGELTRYRCHTGHAFTARALEDALDDALEQSLWESVRVMEERARLLDRLVGDPNGSAASLGTREQAEDLRGHAARIRELLTSLRMRARKDELQSGGPNPPA